MIKTLIIILLLMIEIVGFAQNHDIEYWRKLGYEAKVDANYEDAISNYSKILKITSDDYDAKLALARLHTLSGDYKKAILYFNDIYINDSTDVEALKGLGDCSLYMNKLETAINYYNKVIFFLPSYIPAYFQLAKAYSWQGKFSNAIDTYEKILAIDSTRSGAWQGIGKMLYWQREPEVALQYYRKAIQQDPESEIIISEYHKIVKQLDYQILSTFKILNETENEYQINALIQNYNLQKRFSDHYNISANFLLDYSNRDFTNDEIADTVRWFNNIWVKGSWITKDHKIDLYGGISESDNKLSSYGLNWNSKFSLKSLNFTNSLSAGYDYFYYWNKVGHHNVSDNLSVRYQKFTLNLRYGYGIVDSVMLTDFHYQKYSVDFNKNQRYGVSFSYKLLSKPKINLALNYSYLDYEYKSSLYYTPFGRTLYGPSGTIYNIHNNFYYYGSFSYNIGSEYYFEKLNSEEKTYLNVDNWSAEVEMGYNLNSASFSLGASRFYNPYYTNYLIQLSLKIYL